MADSVLTKTTTLPSEEAITRAIQFFSTASWRATSQGNRAVTFAGRPPIPWFTMLLTILGFIFCFIPGLIMYFVLVKKARRFQNIVVTATPQGTGSDVTVTFPPHARKLATGFLEALPA